MPELNTFYKNRFQPGLVVSCLALDHFHYLLSEAGEQTEQVVYEVSDRVLKECCGVQAPTEEHYVELLERINKISTEAVENQQEEEKSSNRPDSKKGYYAKDFEQYIKKLDLKDLLYQLTSYDYLQAEHLYCEVDRDIVMGMVKTYIAHESQKNKLMFEACVYGFGGELKSDPRASANDKTFDLSTNKKEAMSALKGLGIGFA